MIPRVALMDFIAQRRVDPFSWKTGRDCCLLAADARIALGDEDFAADLRGYTSKAGALKALKKAGFNSVGDLMRTRLKRVDRARVGTIIMLADPPLDVLLVAEGARRCWGQDEAGLLPLPIPDGATFWEP